MLKRMEKQTKFLKVGDKIIIRPSVDGLEYELENGKVYNVQINKYTDEVSLNLDASMQLPEKIYSNTGDEKFINKVINSYSLMKTGTLGVMLDGLKGSGKTVLAKLLAVKSDLPIINVDKYVHPRVLNKLLKDLDTTEVCILFDEIDKNGEDYDDNYLLRVLDGTDCIGKKMMIMTANNGDEINEYMKDRCSRIRYWKKFDEMPASLIHSILEDKLENKNEVKSVVDFIQENFKCISFDNVLSFANEVNANPKDSFEELFEDMNLSQR